MNLFTEFSLVIVLVTIVSLVVYRLKQPLVIAYIITGLLVGYLLNLHQETQETMEILSQFGIAFLLFIIGLNLKPTILKEVGKISVITGIGQVLFTSIVGFFISLLLGFSIISSIYIAIALTFSSTIIILKILSDKKAVDKLYGKISIGFLLVQDIVAVIILMFISAFAQKSNGLETIGISFLSGILITVFVVLFTILFIQKILDYIAKSQELLFLFTIGWGLGIASLYYYFGFSMEIGALIAGVALASSKYSVQISSKTKPLRDFFLILFFIVLGSQLVVGNINEILKPAIIFSFFIIIGNPLIVFILMTRLGYTRKNSFLAGLTVAQISEFSLILILLGIKVGHLDESVLPLVTLVGLVTIITSTYFMIYSDQVFHFIKPFLKLISHEKHSTKENKISTKEILLFGCNRIGNDILDTALKNKLDISIVDYNPDIIKKMEQNNISAIYGDAADNDFLDTLNLEKTKMIISTIPDFEVNQFIILKVTEKNKKAIIVVLSYNTQEAISLYENGATYVLTPHFLGGKYTSMLISKHGFDLKRYLLEKERHIKRLKNKHEVF